MGIAYDSVRVSTEGETEMSTTQCQRDECWAKWVDVNRDLSEKDVLAGWDAMIGNMNDDCSGNWGRWYIIEACIREWEIEKKVSVADRVHCRLNLAILALRGIIHQIENDAPLREGGSVSRSMAKNTIEILDRMNAVQEAGL
jgi:hypothetical protein